MNYIDKLASDIGSRCGLSMDNTEERRLLRIYAVIGRTCKYNSILVSNEDVHDAWTAWQSESNPLHKSAIPFEELTEKVQDLDSKYRDAIRGAVSDEEQ